LLKFELDSFYAASLSAYWSVHLESIVLKSVRKKLTGPCFVGNEQLLFDTPKVFEKLVGVLKERLVLR
jgi:hypothetical protein